MENTLTHDLSTFIKNGYASVQADWAAAREAAELARQNENEYQAELRRRLVGRLVSVTGTTVTAQRMGQDGLEHITEHDALTNEQLVVTGVFLTRQHNSITTIPRTPLVYAARPGRNGTRQLIHGSEVSFRLLDADFTILDQ